MGLPAREEAELRRLLDIVADRTLAHWTFLEAIDADVAFCEPRSALARVYLHHRNAPGIPVCVALGTGSDDLPWPHRVALPLDPPGLQDVLDRIEADAIAAAGETSDGLVDPVADPTEDELPDGDPIADPHSVDGHVIDGHAVDAWTSNGSPDERAGLPPVASLAVTAERVVPALVLVDPATPEGVAMDIDRGELADFGRDFIDATCALLERMRDDTHGAVWRFEWGGRAFDVFFPERSYRYDGDASTEMLMVMGVSAPLGPGRRLGPAEAVSARHVGQQKPLDTLLWRIGLHMAPRDDLPWARQDVRVRLRRWPDFGHLGAHRPHFAIAAQMSRHAWSAEDLARTSGQDPADVHAFLNACGLCGLLDIEHGGQVAPPPEPPRRVSGLFRRLRDALGIGA